MPEYRFANSWTCLNAPFIRASRLWLTPICCRDFSCKIPRDLPSCWAHCDTGTQHINDIYSLLYVLRWVQSLHGLLSIVSILIALLPSWIPFSSTLPFFLSLSLSLSHTHTRVSGPESGRAAAKGLTDASWREVTALCITRWHWQLTDGYHSHTSTEERGKERGRDGGNGGKDDSPALSSLCGVTEHL